MIKARLKHRAAGQDLIVADFEAADLDFTFMPGEYVQIILPASATGGPAGEKRYFSVVSSPAELPIFRIGTRPSQSLFKKTLAEIALGSEVDVNGPWGDLVLPAWATGGPDDKQERSFYFVAGGIGVTPFVSMLKYKTEEHLPYSATLLYFCDDPPLFKNDLETAAGGSIKTRLLFLHQRISTDVLGPLLEGDFKNATFFVAGPPGFVNAANKTLLDLQIPQGNIIFESYTGYMN